jgi:hypothetical protein
MVCFGSESRELANKGKEYGLAQWRSYPEWVRGPARIVGDEVVLDEERAEAYGIHERAKDHIFLELAELTEGRSKPDPRDVVSFVRRNGLLWHGADGVDTGECRESLAEWWIESWTIRLLLEVYVGLKDSIREGSASTLRSVYERFPEVAKLAPLDAEDERLMDETSANLAEVITSKLEGCQLGLTSSVYVDTDVRGPGIFFILQRPPNLLSAIYVHLAQFMANRAPLEECPGCGRMFVRRSHKQKYCQKSCASTNRWRRWKNRQAELSSG